MSLDAAFKAKVAAMPVRRILEMIPLKSSSSFNTSLSNEVYEHVLTELLFPDDGTEVGFGKKITESQIANKLGVSNGPVRNALMSLRQEGWIITMPNRGSYVVDFTDSDICRQIYSFRINVEVGAFYCLASTITEQQLTELKHLVTAMGKAVKKGEVLAYRKSDIDFHLKVMEFAGGESLRDICRPKWLQWFAMSYHILRNLSDETWIYNEAIAHDEIIDALAAHDKFKVAELVSKHYSFIANVLGIGQESDTHWSHKLKSRTE